MRGRPGSRIGVAVYPPTGRAEGIWWLGDVYLGRRVGNWPIETTVVTGRVAPAMSSSPASQIQFTQIKTDGGTLE